MKKIKTVSTTTEMLEGIVCNCCGKEIEKSGSGRLSDYLSVDKDWGYLSPFDLENHSFDICVECYNRIIGTFKIPVRCF